ncbi:MAG: hypothetical protein LBG59_05440 [Candidatus Peribacteria bacterium]|nr:hypothetical protein [Candidatus Peribacteria bacterium]
MKTKSYFFIVFVAMMFLANASSWAQSDYAGERTVTSPGNVDLTSWIVPTGQSSQKYLLKIVAEHVEPQLVNTGVSAWDSPSYRSFPLNYPEGYTYTQWAPCFLPGLCTLDGGAKGGVTYVVSYTTDPWVGVDQEATTASPHVSSFSGGIINAQNFASIKISSIFSTGSFTNWLVKIVNGNFQTVDQGKDLYQVSETGDYASKVVYTGSSFSYSAYTYFSVNIAGTPPTVENVLVSPASASVEKGTGKQFTATVQGQHTPEQGVSWTVEGNTSASTTINATGYLSVGNDEHATPLIVRATSVVDPTKSGTATVNVTSPPPTQYTIVVTANPTTGGAVIGGGTFNEGTSQTVTATPASGWRFVNWAENGILVSADVAYSFTLNGNRSLVANFEQIPPETFQVVFTVNLLDAVITLGDRTQTPGQRLFDGLLPGVYAYSVSRDGFQTISGNLEITDQSVTINIPLVENPPEENNQVPIFRDLKGTYNIGDASVPLVVIGEGMETLTFIITVNGSPATSFTPSAGGSYRIEAVSSNGLLKIWKHIKVQ